MILIEDVLGREQALAIGEALDHAPFQDGSLTAGSAARKVKQNTQALGDDAGVAALGDRVRLALEGNALVRRMVRPVRWSNLLFSRYSSGQQYGLHADNAAMVDEHGWPLRTDVSFTLFLSDPDTYGGGSLLIPGQSGDREFRLGAGSAVFYPTGLLHRVTPVTAATPSVVEIVAVPVPVLARSATFEFLVDDVKVTVSAAAAPVDQPVSVPVKVPTDVLTTF